MKLTKNKIVELLLKIYSANQSNTNEHGKLLIKSYIYKIFKIVDKLGE